MQLRSFQGNLALANHAIDSDTFSAPLRAPIIARHRGRYTAVRGAADE